jgi:hypothetical protein
LELIEKHEAPPDVFENLPPDFLIPILIALSSTSSPIARASSVLKVSKVPGPPSDNWHDVASELAKRADDKNRVLWSKVVLQDREDLTLPANVTLSAFAIALLGLIAILVRGAMGGLLSWWWLSLPGSWMILLCVAAITDKTLRPLRKFGILLAPRWSLLPWPSNGTERAVALLFLTLGACQIIVSVITAFRLGGYWPVLAAFSIIMAALPLEGIGTEEKIVLARRSNPLRRLREALAAKGKRDPTPAAISILGRRGATAQGTLSPLELEPRPKD